MGKMLEQLFSQKISQTSSALPGPGLEYHVIFPEGKGILIDYPVAPGAELLLNEYHGTYFNHRHIPVPDMLQINYCLQGRMGWHLKDGDCIYLSAGDISIHRMNHCASSTMYFPYEYYRGISILLDCHIFQPPDALRQTGFHLDTLADKYCPGEHTAVLPATEQMKSFFSMLDTIPLPCRSCYFQIKLQELLLFLYTREDAILHAENCSHNIDKTIQEIQRHLTSNLRERPTIEALAKEFLINTSTLKKAFKEIYGQPIAQYMKDYRMHYAANLLCQSDLSVREISKQVGYGNPSKFSSAFREVMQISPLEYRTRYKRNGQES